MNDPFRPIESLKNLLNKWRLLVLLALAGGGLGYILHFAFPAIYESTSVFSVNIDFSRTGELTDIEEDMAIVAVGDIIKSTDVMDTVVDNAQSMGLIFDRESLSDMLFLERENSRWLLIARTRGPELSADLSNLWAEEANQAIQSAYAHATTVDKLELYMDGLADCLQEIEIDDPAFSLCPISDLDELQFELKETSTSLQQEKVAAMGLMPASNTYLQSEAEVSSKPVIGVTAELILSGAVMGFIAGIWIIDAGVIDELLRNQKNKRAK